MSVLLSDLVRDVQLTQDMERDAISHRKEAETRLADGLGLIGKPLNVGGAVVIGDMLVKRPYEMLAMVLSPIANVSPQTVVVDDTPDPAPPCHPSALQNIHLTSAELDF